MAYTATSSGAHYGGANMVAPLRRVFLRRPDDGACARWREFGWRSAPDPAALRAEHEGFCELLDSGGAEVVVGAPVPGALDAIYTFDLAVVSGRGAIVLRSGKELRQAESAATAADLERAGIRSRPRSSRPRPWTEETRSGSTTRHSSSAAATERMPQGSRRFARPFRTWR